MEQEVDQTDDSSISPPVFTHQYPDPENVPRFLWQGEAEIASFTWDLDTPMYDARPIRNDFAANDSDRGSISIHGTGNSHRSPSADSDYQYREDSAK